MLLTFENVFSFMKGLKTESKALKAAGAEVSKVEIASIKSGTKVNNCTLTINNKQSA